MSMGERIKRARTEAKLSQEAFGKRIGVSKGAVSQWENDDVKNLKMANLFAMADATEFSARWLAIGEGPERTENIPPLHPDQYDSNNKKLSNEDLAALLHLAADQLSSK